MLARSVDHQLGSLEALVAALPPDGQGSELLNQAVVAWMGGCDPDDMSQDGPTSADALPAHKKDQGPSTATESDS